MTFGNVFQANRLKIWQWINCVAWLYVIYLSTMDLIVITFGLNLIDFNIYYMAWQIQMRVVRSERQFTVIWYNIISLLGNIQLSITVKYTVIFECNQYGQMTDCLRLNQWASLWMMDSMEVCSDNISCFVQCAQR